MIPATLSRGNSLLGQTALLCGCCG